MSDGNRPGGLTALAVLNFVLGGFYALAVIGSFAILGLVENATDGDLTVPNEGVVWLGIFLLVITVGLLIASGVGYLGQKLFLGRKLGNAYAIASFINIGVGLTIQDFGIGTIIGLVYPLLTLALINTTFKDDLIN
jgi:hypothetical protein